jgi:hypothetical protein
MAIRIRRADWRCHLCHTNDVAGRVVVMNEPEGPSRIVHQVCGDHARYVARSDIEVEIRA